MASSVATKLLYEVLVLVDHDFYRSFAVHTHRHAGPSTTIRDRPGRYGLTCDNAYLPGIARKAGRGRGARYSGREGRIHRWTDGVRATLDDKLPDVLAEIEIRAAEDAYRDNERRRREAEEQRRRELAIERATVRLVEDDRVRHFTDQVNQWTLAVQAREYVAAMRATIEAHAADTPATSTSTANGHGDGDGQHEREIAAARQWLTWAERYVAGLDPLTGPLAMPPPPQPTADALRPFLHGHDR